MSKESDIMKKLRILVLICVIISALIGCSNSVNVADEKNDSTFSSVSNSQNSYVDESVTKDAKVNNQITSTTEITTTKVSTTKKQTTTHIEQTTRTSATKPQTTTTKPITTQKVTTTKKLITTKRETTTKAQTTKGYFCDEGGTHHSCDVGPIGWVNSYDEAQQKALRYIDSHADSGNFTVEQCWYCGKYTAEVTLD
jgi:cytoskeletal protein RodZ